MCIFGLYTCIALIIVLLVYTPRLSGFFSSFNGIQGTFYSPAATMFALISAFMGATLVSGFNAHTESINQERTALLQYVDFINITPQLTNQNLQYQVKHYLQSALDEEWPL
jgi:preprotein translocase subunit SecG